ncbi:PAS domain-containing sensor histidine kinase [Rosettibacter firmus]|uniref:PAS domain-containing sensor histidine kinase n=1 Tax=Rosettibacter firmus TaxID=3111522 RepID=UPI00336C068D
MSSWINFHNTLKNSDEEFFNYKELPNIRALAIVSPSLDIIFCNNTFTDIFKLKVKDNLNRLNPGSEFLVFVKGFIESKYKNLLADLSISSNYTSTDTLYQIGIERIIISYNQYLLITVESLEQRKIIEKKIDSLHHALDYGRVPIIIINNQRKIVYATSSFEEIFSRGLEKLFNAEILEVMKEYLNQNDLDNFSFSLNNGKVWKQLVEIKKRGEYQYWDFNLQPFYPINSNEINFVLSANNLTEHVFQKKVIEESEKKQKLIIENISDLLLILKSFDNKIYFENANDNFCKLFNLEKSKIYLQLVNDFLPPQLYDLIEQNIKILENNDESFQQFFYHHSSGQHFNCKITSANLNGNNSKIFIITLKDVTDETKYREQLEKNYLKEIQLNKMKSAFIANISHEIRTPFNGIIGYSEIIDDCLAAKDYVALKEIMDSVKEVLGRVLNAFTNIVELSQIESDEVELEMVVLNCNQVIRQVFEKRLNEAEKKNLTFKLELYEEEAFIEIDWIKLEKIIDVLIDNAIKYTKSGFVYLGSRINKDKVEIIVADSGIGIESSQIDRILLPFSQEIEGYTRPYEGIGLGLTIAYKLTKLMGGDFRIQSEKNKGTEIIISFPRFKM